MRVAETVEEREAIYRFRYSVYVGELGAKVGLDDQGRPWVHDDEDERPYTTLLYSGSPDDITGTLRLRHWRPGEVPQQDWQDFSMELFPGLDQLGVGELGRVMTKPGSRNLTVLSSLMRALYPVLVEHDVDVGFGYCSPALLRFWRKIGYQPYNGRLMSSPAGICVPMVWFPSDVDYLERSGSLFGQLAPQYFGPGKRPILPIERYAHLLDAAIGPVVTDADAVWARVQEELAAADAERGWMRAISPRTLEKLAASGVLLDVPAGETLMEKGLAQQEMFAILEGLFEVVDGDRRLALVGAGEVVGEMAFFGSTGRRSASVRALVDGQVLVLERRPFDRLRSSDPASAAEILLYVAGVLADRAGSAIG